MIEASRKLLNQGFLRRFRDPIQVLKIRENRVPTGPYQVLNILLKKTLCWTKSEICETQYLTVGGLDTLDTRFLFSL